MTITVQTITGFFSKSFARIVRHVYALLFVFFIGAIGCAGFIFWQYGYQASLKEPEVSVHTVTPREGDLRMLIEKMKERDASRDVIVGKTFQDPFIKPATAQP